MKKFKSTFCKFKSYNISGKTMNTAIFILIILAIWGVKTQQNATILELNKIYSASLQPEQAYVYQTILPGEIPSNYDFFFVVQWPISDPLQYPFIDITFGDGSYLTCYKSNDQFSGVCRIPSNNLRPNATITSQIYCFVQCKLTITPLLQKRLRMSLNDTHTFNAPISSGLPVEIEIQVPYDINYTQIAVYAQIDSMEKANEGLEMFANIGDQNETIPTRSSYDEFGQSIYWGGKGIFLSKEDIKPGQFIKLYIYISQGMTVKIYANYLYGNSFMIGLGKTYYDYTTYQENKLYLLDLRKETANITGKTITIGFLVYSGSPFITIAMESSFLNPINQQNSISTSTYLITESVRSQYNFSGVIYIKVESSWSSNYLIFTGVEQKNYITIFPDITLFNELEPNDVFNYFFDDLITPTNATDSTIRSYSIRVDMIKGHTTFGVRRCRSAETGQSILKCALSATNSTNNDAVKASFQEISITMKKSDNYYYISFQYDTQQCSHLNVTSNDTRYYCSFHIVAIEKDNISADYTITLNKRRYTTTLMEGALTRDYIYKDEYLYFRFIIGSLDEVVSVTFFTTIIEGDIYLLGSIVDEFPTMESDGISFSVGSYLTFSKNKLAKTIYVSAYGIELSEFTLGVKVTRRPANITNNTNTTSEKNTSQTKLALKIDLSQQFALEENDTSVVFLMSTPSTMNITTEVIQLAGTVNLEIKDANNNTVNCSDRKSTNNKITCTFQATQKATYSAVVTANKGDTQKFIIFYHKQDACIAYTLNRPLFLQLEKGEKTCITYSLTKTNELQVTSTVPLSNLIDQSLHMVICINNNCLAPTLSHHTLISKNQLISYCNFARVNNTNVFQSCPIKLNFASNTSIIFEVVVEEQGKDIGLFDGIVEKINTYDLTRQNGKYFYYEIYQWSAIKIYFTSLTSNSYYVALHFVEETKFLNNSANIYLPFRQTNYDLHQKFEQNFFEAIVYGSNTNIFTISSNIVDKYCDKCFLTIAVYPLYTTSRGLTYFQIEVTQAETVLFIGSSKLGYLQTDEIYNYQLQVSEDSDALLTIADLSKESKRQQNCFTASLTSSGDDYPLKVEDGMAYIKKGSLMTNLYVQATDDNCNYEVTYIKIDFPLIVATSNRKYQFIKDYATKIFILYTHSSPLSFKITRIINTGILNIYATPVGNQSVLQLTTADLQTFAFISTDKSGQFQVSSTSSKFCFNCQYLIVLQTPSAVNSEIIIANFNSSIPLSVNGIIQQKIIASELKVRNFTFNSISAFNITISPIYGKLKVTVIDPSRKVIINQNVSATVILSIPHNKQTEQFSFDFNSYYTRYDINIESDSDCSFTIKASKENLTSRLFQGIPLYYTFANNEVITLEFLNLNTASAASNSLNILVDLLEHKNNTNITVNAAFESKEGEAPVDLPITNLVKSDSVYNIEIPLKVGTYYIKIGMNLGVKTSIILVKQSLIHLRPSTNAIMFKEGVFELYSSDRSAMIEIFACWGDISVDASSYYKDLSATGQQYGEVVLEQNNYGGHFVINAENIYGEYFIKVGNKQKHQSQMGYLITYYYYNSKDVLPYKAIDLVDREITYTLSKTEVTFSFNPVTINWDISHSIESVFIQYRIYIADNKNKVSKFANCRLGDIYWTYAVEKEDYIQATIDISKISEIVSDQSIYFVGAEAIVFIEPSESADEDYPEELNLIYETIELSNVRLPPHQQQTSSSYSVQIIILWFLMPFAIAGVVLYFALKYCIKKYRGFVPNELIEEGEHGQSEQGVHLPDASPYSAHVQNPNNASQSMKEDI